MRKLYLLSCLTLLCFSFTNPSSWELFKSFEGRFEVLAPGEFEEKVKEIETAIGKVEYHTFLHKPEGDNPDNLAYLVSYCDYPAGSIHSDSTSVLDEFFGATLESAQASVKGELLYSNEVDLSGYPGRQWRIDYNEGKGIIKTKSFLVNNRYYSIQTIMIKQNSLNESTPRFMNSFQLFK